MRSAIAAGALAMVLAGCGKGEEQQQAAPKIRIHTPAQEQLHTASALNRSIALKRAIYDSGYRCQRIAGSGFVGVYENLDMWTASCADGRDWAIFIGPDGSAQVRDCQDVAKVGLPKCAISSEKAGAGTVG